MKPEIKKQIILHLPYLMFVYLFLYIEMEHY